MTGPERDIDAAIAICKAAGTRAREYFDKRGELTIEAKGRQDWVTAADRNVETQIRTDLAASFPNDGIVGEEHADTEGTSGFRWVIDPIDGTANFIAGIPTWCVVLAGVFEGKTRIGIIHDPIHDETFVAEAGKGATLNGAPISVAHGTPIDNGTISLGYSNRASLDAQVKVFSDVVHSGAKFHRNASGAITLAYLAAGRFLGYLEQHMNAWDCLAGQLLVAEAGGTVEVQDADDMISNGGRVVASAPQVFDQLRAIADRHWPGKAP